MVPDILLEQIFEFTTLKGFGNFLESENFSALHSPYLQLMTFCSPTGNKLCVRFDKRSSVSFV